MTARHPCPGPCDRQIQPHLHACSGCWARLPDWLRSQINDQMRATRSAIAQQVATWFERR